MGSSIQERGGEDLESNRSVLPTRYGRRLGSGIGLATISILDLLALDDITTAGAWMPEIVFLIASIPALVVLAFFTFRSQGPPSPDDGEG
jgi:hypothetical protein